MAAIEPPRPRSQHGPKLRSRKDGAAVALDDLDKRLLNLMQGSFPIAPRPFAHVAAAAETSEEEVLARVARLLEEVRWEGPCAPRQVRSFAEPTAVRPAFRPQYDAAPRRHNEYAPVPRARTSRSSVEPPARRWVSAASASSTWSVCS